MINTVLAVDANVEQILGYVMMLPLVALGIGALVGFGTGIRKMSWGIVAWMVAVNVYSVLLKVLQGYLGEFGEVIPVIVAAVVCATVSMLVFAVVRLVIYPREKKMDNKRMQDFLRREDRFRRIEREEFEELDDPEDADEVDRLERMQDRRRRKYLDKLDGRPNFLSRLLAAVVMGLDYMFVCGVIVDTIVVLINATPLATGLLADICATQAFQDLWDAAEKNILDYLLIGGLMCGVYKGYEKGILSSLYSLLSTVAYLLGAVLAFWIPFSPYVAEGRILASIGELSVKFSAYVEGMLVGVLPFELPAGIMPVVGQIITGVLLCVVIEIVIAISMKMLLHFVNLSAENSVFHAIDGVFGVVLGIAVCVIVTFALLFGLQLVEALGWYSASELLFVDTNLLKVCYNEVGRLTADIIQKIVALFPVA